MSQCPHLGVERESVVLNLSALLSPAPLVCGSRERDSYDAWSLWLRAMFGAQEHSATALCGPSFINKDREAWG